MEFNFKTHAKIDVSNIKRKVLEYTQAEWDDYDFRQKNFYVHKQTKTIPLYWDEKLIFYKVSANPKRYSEADKYDLELQKISSVLTNQLGPGFMATAMLINLPSKKIITTHKDVGNFFKDVNRIHIPIVTAPECLFIIDGEKRNLKEGEVVEIDNNNKFHSVENNSDVDRVHLLIDWLRDDIQHKI